MRSLRLLLLAFFGVWHCALVLLGAEFHLNNGDIIRGEPVSFNDDGMVVRLEIGGHSPRISWSKMTQETLQELLKNPQATKFVEPFIDMPPVPKDKDNKKKDIIVKPVPRVERVEKASFLASLASPIGLAIVLVLYLGNLYAAYHIARYRQRPPALVCGLSAILPVLAPALFLAMPPAPAPEFDEESLAEPAAAAQAAGKATTGPLAKTPMASGLSVAAQADKGPAAAPGAPQVYKRGEFTFNRRFMETKFASFFRLVQSEGDRDLVMAIRTNKDEVIAKRISRISTNEMHVQQTRGTELMILFAEIAEIQVRREPKA